jgi:hypothetical protein
MERSSYRIREVTNGLGQKYFMPQFRHPNGQHWETLMRRWCSCFDTFAEAKKLIDAHKEEERIRKLKSQITEIIHEI